MYARLVEIDGIEAARHPEMLAMMRDQVIPSMKEAEGFDGFVSLVDEQTGRVRNVVLWETRDSAEHFEREWVSRREDSVRGLGGMVRSTDLYEVPLVEVKANVHA